MERPSPTVDVQAAADEVKRFLDGKKMDLIDWGYVNIECYPDPEDDEYPVLKGFAKLWEDLFSYAETLTIDNDGTGFPEDLVNEFEAKLAEIKDAVNSDEAYWGGIRAAVLPMYRPPEGVEIKPKMKAMMDAWEQRWKAVDLFYDVMGLEIQTTKMWTNKQTGERRRGEIISQRTMPPGFVIKVI